MALILLDKLNIHPSVDNPIQVGDGSAVLLLIFLAHDSDPQVRIYAIELLASLNNHPDDRAIAPIIEDLGAQDMGVRLAALTALQAYGPKARAAIPKLIALSDDLTLGRWARQALEQIDPEEAKKLRPLK